MATFQERFNALFDEYKESQEEFGKRFGASKSQIFNWRNGRGEPDSEMMKVIAAKCGVNIAWLLGFADQRQSIYDVQTATPCVKESPSVAEIISHAESMHLPPEYLAALQDYKQMPLTEQQSRLAGVVTKFKSLSVEDQEALIRIINSLSDRAQQ